MRYVTANKEKAKAWGFSELGHVMHGDIMILNEKEVAHSVAMSGDLEARAEELGGEILTATELKMKLMKTNKTI